MERTIVNTHPGRMIVAEKKQYMVDAVYPNFVIAYPLSIMDGARRNLPQTFSLGDLVTLGIEPEYDPCIC